MMQTEADRLMQALPKLEALQIRVQELERQVQLYQRADMLHRQSAEFHRQVIEKMRGGIVKVAMDGTIAETNAEALAILGLTHAQMTSRGLSDFAPVTLREDGSPFPVEEYCATKCLKTGQPQPPVMMGLRRSDGVVKKAIVTAAPTFDPQTARQDGAMVTVFDITEQARADTALLQLTAIFTQAHTAVIETDLTGVIRMWSHGAKHLYGYESEEAIGRNISFLFEAEGEPEAPRERDPIQQTLSEGEYEKEVRFRAKSGDRGWAHLSMSLMRYETGTPSGVISHSVDLSDRKRAEQAARVSEERYRKLFDANPMPMMVFELATLRILAVNDAAVDHYGYSRDEFLRIKVDEIRPKEDVPALMEAVRQAQTGRTSVDRTRHIKKDGTIIEVETTGHSIEFGGRAARLVQIHDVTLRRQAEAARAASDERYRTLIETTATGYVVVDQQGRVLDANTEYVRLSGHRTVDDIRGRIVIEWTAPHDLKRNEQEVRKCMRQGFVRNLEIDYLGPNGALTPIEINASVIQTDQGSVILGLCRDISDRRRAEAQLRESTERQRMVLRELDHRVRNNLASLSGLIDIFSLEKSSVPEFAAAIRSRVHAMAAVHDLLSRARWASVGLLGIVRALVPEDVRDRVAIAGPDALTTPRQLTAFGMMMQELIANSLKYGALRSRHGRVDIAWTVDGEPSDAERPVQLTWRESGGPPIDRPPKAGQGTALILGFARSALQGTVELTYPREGASHTINLVFEKATE